MTTRPAESGQPHLPSMRTIGELRAALTMGYGFAGDADDFEAVAEIRSARENHR